MSKSKGLIKSHIVKKYWMAFTGLFLCLFLLGHLAGNLQLFIPGYKGQLQFNEYAVFMTTNPAVKLLSYVTYISILFHAIDGIVISVNNKKARPQGYAFSRPGANSIWSSRNMGILGTIIFVYIVVHMQNFWYLYKFGEVPYQKAEDNLSPLLNDGTVVKGGEIINGEVVSNGEVIGIAMKDLYTVVLDGFQNPVLVAFYVIGMVAIAFHLVHGFQSGFQSLGLRNKKYSPMINKAGFAFAILVPALFAIIPIYMFIRL
ncbi:MAG: succinate dehydrogenase [Verrucomicrobia bacterium]|nr:succinate dehydrogenase [Verrucomicrobiota bacterium]